MAKERGSKGSIMPVGPTILSDNEEIHTGRKLNQKASHKKRETRNCRAPAQGMGNHVNGIFGLEHKMAKVARPTGAKGRGQKQGVSTT